MNKKLLLAFVFALPFSGSPLLAQTTSAAKDGEAIGALAAAADDLAREPEKSKKASPWLLVPLVATNPKLGTAVGGLAAYLHYFDPQSQLSMFGLAAEYSTTHSTVGGVFARTSFRADHHRLVGFAGIGYIENEYQDYLGTGQTFKTTDDLGVIAARYLYRVAGNWFIGTQAAFANYKVSGATPADDEVLDLLGLTGFNSGGIGLALMHDSRDNPDMPVKGWYAALNNFANREWLGAESNYGTYRLDTRWFLEHGSGHVFAVRQNNQFTVDAPPSAEATILLRGYKIEQYLGRYMSSLEGEERIRFSRRWGATIFGGVAWLYGGSKSPVDSNGAYPCYGAGFHFVLKPEERMLVNLEYAHGNLNNYGVYLRFGYAW